MLMNIKPVYHARNISFRRSGRKVLDDISITIEAGELTALIGPNSAGKSTLLEILLGLVKNETGSILLQQRPLSDFSPTELATTVAYLPQQHETHWPISVYDYVALGRIPHNRFARAASKDDIMQIEQVIDKTDIRHLITRPVTNLSGGELCRVSIARVLAVNADVIMVDEPIAGLDPSHQLSVMQLLKNEAESGRAVVTVIHDLSLACRFCDTLWLLDKGKMVCSGTADKVLTDEHLRQVYQVTSKIIQSSPIKVIMPWERISE